MGLTDEEQFVAEGNDRNTTIIVAVIGAIALITAALIGVSVRGGSDQASDPRADTSVRALPLSSRAAPSNPAPSYPSPSPTSAIRQSYPLTLMSTNGQIDLDVVDDPQWGATNMLGDNGDQVWDIGSSNAGGVELGTPGVLVNATPTYETCHDATGLSATGTVYTITFTALQRAKGLCVFTTGGRIAVLTILSADAQKADFSVTTYDKDGD